MYKNTQLTQCIFVHGIHMWVGHVTYFALLAKCTSELSTGVFSSLVYDHFVVEVVDTVLIV